MRRSRLLFWAVSVLVVVGVLTWVYLLRLRILEQWMGDAMTVDDEVTVRSLAGAFPCPLGAKDASGQPALAWAVMKGHADVAARLIARGADVNGQRSEWGWTPLHWAAASGQTDMTRMLLAAGADPAARDNQGRTPIHEVVSTDGRWILEVFATKFVDHGALGRGSVAEQTLIFRRPVAWVGPRGQEEVLRLLIASGADVNARESQDATPLHYAVSREGTRFVRMLTDADAEVNAADREHETALQKAATRGRLDVVRLLVATGADAPNIDGAVLSAAVAKHAGVVTFLRSARKAPQAPFPFWKTATGAAADRMLAKPGGRLCPENYRALWKAPRGERLVWLAGGLRSSVRPKIRDDEYRFEVLVFDATMERVRTGHVEFTEKQYPYALVEVFSESEVLGTGSRGKWTLGLALVRCQGGWGKLEGAIDETKPIVLTARRTVTKDAPNTVTVRLIEWERDASVSLTLDPSRLEDVKFRWAETSPCIFDDLQPAPVKR